MKKFLVGLLLVFIITVVLIYFLIPRQLQISSISVIKANEHAAFRSLANDDSWKKWWPGKHEANSQKIYSFNEFSFKTRAKQFDGIEVMIRYAADSLSSVLKPSGLSSDSMWLSWTATINTSANPFDKLNKYFQAKKLTRQLNQLLRQFKDFAEKKESLYGIDVKQATVRDTILMVIRSEQKEKPGIAEVYKNINVIKNYIATSGAGETNHPMLNIRYLDEKKIYELMVAVPTDKHLPGTEMILWKRMIPGNILYADVRGGEATVEAAMKQMENYAFDHEDQSPALPYQLLVTNRMSEKDTAKWVTRIYYPIL